LSRLNLHQGEPSQEGVLFLKQKLESKPKEQPQKLAIGFKSNEAEEEIDENALLEGENLEINKPKAESCSTKVRACANCSCGRKEVE
jgi:hypothetical protein